MPGSVQILGINGGAEREFGSHEGYGESEVEAQKTSYPQQWLCNYRNMFSTGKGWGSLEKYLTRNLPSNGREGQQGLRWLEKQRGREPARPVNGSHRCGREKERRAVSLAWQPGGYRAVFNRGLFRSPEAKPGSGLDSLRVSTCGLPKERRCPIGAGAGCSQSSGERDQALSAHRWSSF